MTTELKKTPESNEQTMNDVFELFEPTDNVTAEVIEALKAAIGEASVAEIGNLKKFELAQRIKTAVPTNTMKVAGEVLDFMRENEFVTSDAPATAAAPQGPISVTVEMPEDIATMQLPKLLALLAADPSQFGQVQPYVLSNAQFKLALPRANREKIAVLTADGKLDAAKTVEYIEHLSDPNGQSQPNWRGSKLTTLAKALGRKASSMLNPFTGEPMRDGLDQFGKDWTTMDEDTYRAALWASLTGKVEEPKGSDLRRLTIELFTSPLSAFWQGLVEEYNEAVEDEDPSTVICRMPIGLIAAAVVEALKQDANGPAPTAGGATTATPKPELTEVDYKKMLEEIALAPRRESQSSISLGQTVIESVRTSQGSIHLNGTIVLKGGSTSQGDCTGMCYVPRGKNFSTSQGSNRMEVRPRTYKALFELAQSYNLI